MFEDPYGEGMENDPITLPSLTHGAEDPFRVVIFLILLFIWY